MTEISGFIPTCAGVGGGWRRIINTDISTGDGYPSVWRRDTYSGTSFCREVGDNGQTYASATFSTNGTNYQRVCCKARGYQKGTSVSFFQNQPNGQAIDGYYVDGLSITRGNPHQHIWTFVVGPSMAC